MVDADGGGRSRGFFDDEAPVKLSRTASESYDNRVVYLNYRPQG